MTDVSPKCHLSNMSLSRDQRSGWSYVACHTKDLTTKIIFCVLLQSRKFALTLICPELVTSRCEFLRGTKLNSQSIVFFRGRFYWLTFLMCSKAYHKAYSMVCNWLSPCMCWQPAQDLQTLGDSFESHAKLM